MILWSSHKLELALATGQLSPWSKVKYLMLPVILMMVATPSYLVQPRYGAEEPFLNSLVGTACSVLAALLTYWGIKRCFLANQEIDGEQFFERFAVLFVPPFVRIPVVFLLIGAILVFGGLAIKGTSPWVSGRISIFSAILGPIYVWALYSMVRSSFRRLGDLVVTQESS